MNFKPKDFNHDEARSSMNASCPSLLDVAVYIDGRVTAEQAESIELHLMHCAECALAVRETVVLQHEPDAPMTLVPRHVLDAAQALVPMPIVEMAHARWRLAARRSAIAASVAIIGILGYRVGGGMSPAPTSLAIAGASSAADDLTFGLLADAGDSTAFNVFGLNEDVWESISYDAIRQTDGVLQ